MVELVSLAISLAFTSGVAGRVFASFLCSGCSRGVGQRPLLDGASRKYFSSLSIFYGSKTILAMNNENLSYVHFNCDCCPIVQSLASQHSDQTFKKALKVKVSSCTVMDYIGSEVFSPASFMKPWLKNNSTLCSIFLAPATAKVRAPPLGPLMASLFP